MWLRTAIVAQMDIPLGNSEEDETEDVEAFLDSQEADPDLSDDSNTDK